MQLSRDGKLSAFRSDLIEGLIAFFILFIVEGLLDFYLFI